VSKAWGECPACKDRTLHYILKIKKFKESTRPQFYTTGTLRADGAQEAVWKPGTRTRGRNMIRQCRDCNACWTEELERETEEA
jgi:hypothetical protein